MRIGQQVEHLLAVPDSRRGQAPGLFMADIWVIYVL